MKNGIIQGSMPIPVKCGSDVLSTVNNYLVKSRTSSEELQICKDELLNMDEQEYLYKVARCAHYLRIQSILDIITTFLANKISECKDEKEIRKRFNIPEILVDDS